MPQNNRRPFFNKFGWTQGIDYFCNCATNSYDSLQAKLTKRFSDGYSANANYTLQRARQHGGDQFETDLPEHQGETATSSGPPDWDRAHNFVLSLVPSCRSGRADAYASDVSPLMDAFFGGWQFNTNTIIQSGLPFNVTYRDAGQDRDTGPEPARSDRRSGRAADARSVVQRHADRLDRERVRPAGARHLRQPAAERLRGPGYWRVDASFFKHIPLGEGRNLEFRVEVVNLFNHVNLGNPNGRWACRGTGPPTVPSPRPATAA